MNILIVGGGTAGISIAARLRKARKEATITVIDPAQRHYYQPLWTLVGGGLARFEESDRPMSAVMPRGVEWVQEEVSRVDPSANRVVLVNGDCVTYDALVLVPGIRLAMEEVRGLPEALAEDARVWTNYSPEFVHKGFRAIQSFKGGRAIFTFPNSPVKCGGGPQKIMWIAEEWFTKNNIRERTSVHFVAPGESIFGVPKYREALE